MVSVLSLAMVGCGSDDDDVVTEAYCVEEDTDDFSTAAPAEDGYRVVPDSFCDEDDLDDGSSSYGTYFWYYGGARKASGLVSGGSKFPPSSGTIKTASGLTAERGGFGGSGSSGS